MIYYTDNISYEIVENGYNIYYDGQVWITQREPYGKIFKPKDSYEENCIEQLKSITKEPEEPEQTYTLDEAAAIIASEVADNE